MSSEILKGHSSLNNEELLFLSSACRLIMYYICTKFCEIISKGFRVIERTWFVTDREIDGQTDR